MNKKILISLSVIAAVAAIAIGGTVAYFSDTETSSGNTFTAGSIDLKIDDHCYYNGLECKLNSTANKYQWYNPQTDQYDGDCSCTWVSKDLETGDVFFNFSDVKPGDNGEDTISFNLTSNPAWACVKVTNIVDSDNTCVEPELAAEPACGRHTSGDPNNGELDENLKVTAWVDDGAGNLALACNNVQDTNEKVIVDNQPLSTYIDGKTSVVIPVADSQHGPALQPGNYCIGIKWNVPTTTGNEVQTDKVGADLTFYVEQARNNPNFRCVPPQPIHVQSGALHYGPTGWGGWSCPPNTTVVDGSIRVTGGDLAATYAWKPGATTGSFSWPQTGTSYTYGAGETGYIGQNDNDSGETIYLDFDCMPN